MLWGRRLSARRRSMPLGRSSIRGCLDIRPGRHPDQANLYGHAVPKLDSRRRPDRISRAVRPRAVTVCRITGSASAGKSGVRRTLLLVFAEVSPLEGSADPPVRGGRDAADRAGGAVDAGPVHANASSSMTSAASSIAVKPASFVTSSPIRVSRAEDTTRSLPRATNNPSRSCGVHEAERICRGEPRRGVPVLTVRASPTGRVHPR